MNDLEQDGASNCEAQTARPFMLARSTASGQSAPEADGLNDQNTDVANRPDAGESNRGFSILEDISLRLSPKEMRGLSQSLLKLADAMDQDWSPARSRSKYHWISQAGRIERNAIELAKTAIRIQELGRRRERYIPAEMLGEPSWQMLLELFIQFAGGAKVSTKSLCIISGCPDTTALRQIDQLEAAGLVQRSQSQEDKRVTLIELTRKGVIAVGSTLKDLGD